MRRLIIITLCGLFLLCLSGCAAVTRDPSVPIGLLTKSRDFLVFCIFLLDSSKNCYNQIVSRYYYAMFSIAKLNSLWSRKKNEYFFEKQSDVWAVQTHLPKKVFGEELKKLRVDGDYMPNCNDADTKHFQEGLISIIDQDKSFQELIAKARDVVDKYYPKEDLENSEQCKALLDEIEMKNEEIKRKIHCEGY